MNADGSNKKVLLEGKEFYGLSWSPNGNKIAVGVTKKDGHFDIPAGIAIVDIKNGDLKQIVTGNARDPK